MIEALKHGDLAFITLTYRIQCYAGQTTESGSLWRGHAQKWAKRFRERLGAPVRLFGCGEYGEATQRPHYHFIAYGYPTCLYGRSRYSATTRDCCSSCDLVRDTWGLGNVYLGDVTKDSIQYVAGYVTKKLTSKESDYQKAILGDRHPEFPVWPNKPGLGALGVPDIVNILTSEVGANSLINDGDVPLSLKHGGKSLPFGRYMRRKLREYYGFPEKRTRATSTNTSSTPDGWYQEAAAQMFELLEAHGYDQKKIVESKVQKLLNISSKQQLFAKRGLF